METVAFLQEFLTQNGYECGPIDGILGRLTRGGIRAFQRHNDLVVDGIAGPKTWAVIRQKRAALGIKTPKEAGIIPPWVEIVAQRKGWHEKYNHAELLNWLKEYGGHVDPEETPWCGDLVETALINAIPDTQVPANPMASINWLKYGVSLKEPAYGAIMVFWRGSPDNWQGHVGFYVGESGQYYAILGGNQSNSIRISRIAKSRLRRGGIRWPVDYPRPNTGRVALAGGKFKITSNEE